MEFNEIRKEANKKVLEIMSIINTGNNFEYFSDLDSIQYRIKSDNSIIAKMQKVGDNIYNVYDLIGIRYIFNDLTNYKQLKDYIVNNPNFEIVEIKNNNIITTSTGQAVFGNDGWSEDIMLDGLNQ